VVSPGDRLTGVFDLIADDTIGDVIQTGATNRVSSIALDTNFSTDGGPYSHPSTPTHEHLMLGTGDYAVIHGDLVATGQFQVAPEGHDLLVAFDNNGGDQSFFHNAVVLLGVTNPDWVMVA
jgi:hypothetical protein